jgi:hypothetical protein
MEGWNNGIVECWDEPLPASTPDKSGSTTLAAGEEFKIPPLFAKGRLGGVKKN